MCCHGLKQNTTAMDSNFLSKFKAGITNNHRLASDKPSDKPSDKLKTNTLEAEFNNIAYGSLQQKRPQQETLHTQGRNASQSASSRKKEACPRTNSLWHPWGLSLVNFLTGKQTLSVREKRLKSGERQWRVYDAHSDTHRVFDSEAAVRSWLEQRYYR